METSPKRFSPTKSKFSFLTDAIGFSDESLDVRLRRAEFVQTALSSVTRVITRIQEDIRGLDRQLQCEVLTAFSAMKLSAELRFREAAVKAAEAEAHLKELEEGVDTCEEVASLKREIDLFRDKTEKLQTHIGSLHTQINEFESSARFLTGEIQEMRASMGQIHRGNIYLHKAIDTKMRQVPVKVKTPKPEIYNVVPFDVFLELSSRDVGTLTIDEIQTFIKYKKHVEMLKAYVTVQRAKVRLTRFAQLSERSQTSLEKLFMQCVAVCSGVQSRNPRSFSTMKSYDILPFPEITEFETMSSARLFSIERTKQVAEKQRGKRRHIARREFGEMPVDERVSMVLSRQDCVERLCYFLSHSNRLRPVFDQSTLEVRTQDTKSQLFDSQQDTNRL